VDSGQKFSGVYAAISLSDSLKNLMGHGTVMVEYLVCGALTPRCVSYFLEQKNVVDGRQILVRLDSSPQLRKKIVAWTVTIGDEDGRTEDSLSNFLSKKLMQ
jgi:hypothetical protein